MEETLDIHQTMDIFFDTKILYIYIYIICFADSLINNLANLCLLKPIYTYFRVVYWNNGFRGLGFCVRCWCQLWDKAVWYKVKSSVSSLKFYKILNVWPGGVRIGEIQGREEAREEETRKWAIWKGETRNGKARRWVGKEGEAI